MYSLVFTDDAKKGLLALQKKAPAAIQQEVECALKSRFEFSVYGHYK